MEKEKLKLTFKMNRQMTDYMMDIMIIMDRLEKLDSGSYQYQETMDEYERLKDLFVKEFQSINQDEIDEFQRKSEFKNIENFQNTNKE